MDRMDLAHEPTWIMCAHCEARFCTQCIPICPLCGADIRQGDGEGSSAYPAGMLSGK
jgi:hypothetical protein